MEGFKYDDSSQYESSCKNWTLTVVQLFVVFGFFSFWQLFLCWPCPLYDRVQETFWLPYINRINRKWPRNEMVCMVPQLRPGFDFLNLLFVTHISWVLWSRICYLLNTLNFVSVCLYYLLGFVILVQTGDVFNSHDALKLCPPMCQRHSDICLLPKTDSARRVPSAIVRHKI